MAQNHRQLGLERFNLDFFFSGLESCSIQQKTTSQSVKEHFNSSLVVSNLNFKDILPHYVAIISRYIKALSKATVGSRDFKWLLGT